MYERLLASAPGCPVDLPPPGAYGRSPADLDLDFDQTDRPALVTAILAQCCAHGIEPALTRRDAAWNLPLGRRIARLLQIVALSTVSDALPLTLRCSGARCGQFFEIALGFAQLLDATPPGSTGAEIIQFPVGNAATLALRLPTGRDQAEWKKQSYANAQEATSAIIQSLITNPPEARVDAAQLEPIAAALEEADPLVTFRVSTQCPNCGQSIDLPVDLEQVALQKLAGLRRSLVREIHALATRYGWSEDKIMAVHPARRAEYLKLIADEEETLR